MNSDTRPKQRLWIWFAWLAVFYLAWLYLVFGLDNWQNVKQHWPIAVVMALGSYVAGASPMGGGTVGFPVLVLLFDMPATLGRDFSFAVQSIGMTSASLFILTRRQPLAWAMLKGAMIGSFVGTPLGIIFVAPFFPEIWIKIIFAIVWASFGVLHLYRITEISNHEGMTEFNEQWDFKIGIIIGFFAGLTVASITGVGIDMVLYAALVLLCRTDLKIAIPTSVIIMAFTSVLGMIVKLSITEVQPDVYYNWLAAAPIVALGAPLGAFIVNKIGRKPTLLFVSALCVGQFIWTCSAEYTTVGVGGILSALAFVGVFLFIFEKLRSIGAKLALDAQLGKEVTPANSKSVSHLSDVKQEASASSRVILTSE